MCHYGRRKRCVPRPVRSPYGFALWRLFGETLTHPFRDARNACTALPCGLITCLRSVARRGCSDAHSAGGARAARVDEHGSDMHSPRCILEISAFAFGCFFCSFPFGHFSMPRTTPRFFICATAVTMTLCALGYCAQSVSAQDAAFHRLQLPYGISLDVPAHWAVLSMEDRKNLDAATQAILESAGAEGPAGRKESLLAVNATPSPTGAMIRVSVTSPPEYSQSVLAMANSTDLKEVAAEMLKMFRQFEAAGGPRIIEMLPARIEHLNEHRALVMSYVRTGWNESAWQVTQYKIPTRERLIEITLSYRQSDAPIWIPVLEHVKQSLVWRSDTTDITPDRDFRAEFDALDEIYIPSENSDPSIFKSEHSQTEGEHEQITLQNTWWDCLFAAGRLFAKAREPLAILVEASFAECQQHENALFKYFQSEPDAAVAQFATDTLFPETRKHLESRLKAVVLRALAE